MRLAGRPHDLKLTVPGKVPPEATVAHLPQIALAQIKPDDETVRNAVAGEFNFGFDGGANPRLNGELLYLISDP